MTSELFDEVLGAMRRQRALRKGAELFLHERSFDDILDRLSLVRRQFRSALLVGDFGQAWAERLRGQAGQVTVLDPQEIASIEPGAFDLAIAAGWLDTVNDLPRALLTMRFALEPDGLFIGALSGGDTLPSLRAAMRAADERMGFATPHVHPRIEPAAFTSLLTSAGFSMPVVDVDRAQVSYPSLQRLVGDLRSMGATNVLHARSRKALTRAAAEAASAQFMEAAKGGRVTETFEILHFAAWSPHEGPNG